MKIMGQDLPALAQAHVIALANDVLPLLRFDGNEWRLTDSMANGIRALSSDGIKVIAEVEMQLHDATLDPWIHVSFSREDRMPDYADMKRVKDRFIGKKRKAIMVMPPESEHYNFHKHCLHWFSPLTRDPLPDFRAKGGQL